MAFPFAAFLFCSRRNIIFGGFIIAFHVLSTFSYLLCTTRLTHIIHEIPKRFKNSTNVNKSTFCQSKRRKWQKCFNFVSSSSFCLRSLTFHFIFPLFLLRAIFFLARGLFWTKYVHIELNWQMKNQYAKQYKLRQTAWQLLRIQIFPLCFVKTKDRRKKREEKNYSILQSDKMRTNEEKRKTLNLFHLLVSLIELKRKKLREFTNDEVERT